MSAIDSLGPWLGENPEPEMREFEAALAEAKSRWPDVDVPTNAFAAYLADRIPQSLPLADALNSVCVDDLYLACACCLAIPQAIASFDCAFAREIAFAHARSRPALGVDEAHQLVRRRLLVADEDGPPRIATYQGRGGLRAWVRVAATRLMINLATRAPKDEPGEEAIADLPLHDSPELAYLKRRYEFDFKQAFEQGVSSLSPRERHVIRLAICGRKTVEEIGDQLGVHRATAARWVAAARHTLENRVQRCLRDRLRLGEADVQSMLRIVRSELDLSVSRILAEPER